jgi:hypothetical protein
MRERIGTILGIAMILLCLIIFFSSCTTVKIAPKNQVITKQMIIIDSLGIYEVLPQRKGLKK